MNIKSPTVTDIPRLRMLWKESFGDTDAFLDGFFATAFSPERALAVYQDSEIISALYWFLCEYNEKPVAYIYGVQTAKSSRGNGVCHSLMAAAHKRLAEDGYCGVILVPSNDKLVGFYETMGYRLYTKLGKFSTIAKASGISVCEIDKAEYTQLRRKYLPEGGVVQENENIDFLLTYAKLYKGEDFVMTAYCENGILNAIELLGNTENASGIVHTLGCKKGSFRTPFGGDYFGMYRPFSDNNAPLYFGLAFD